MNGECASVPWLSLRRQKRRLWRSHGTIAMNGEELGTVRATRKPSRACKSFAMAFNGERHGDAAREECRSGRRKEKCGSHHEALPLQGRRRYPRYPAEHRARHASNTTTPRNAKQIREGRIDGPKMLAAPGAGGDDEDGMGEEVEAQLRPAPPQLSHDI